jgi:hypothetical protein
MLMPQVPAVPVRTGAPLLLDLVQDAQKDAGIPIEAFVDPVEVARLSDGVEAAIS